MGVIKIMVCFAGIWIGIMHLVSRELQAHSSIAASLSLSQFQLVLLCCVPRRFAKRARILPLLYLDHQYCTMNCPESVIDMGADGERLDYVLEKNKGCPERVDQFRQA